MSDVPEYGIVQQTNVETFQDEVNAAIQQGWEMIGTPTVMNGNTTFVYTAHFVRHKKKDKLL